VVLAQYDGEEEEEEEYGAENSTVTYVRSNVKEVGRGCGDCMRNALIIAASVVGYAMCCILIFVGCTHDLVRESTHPVSPELLSVSIVPYGAFPTGSF